MGEPTDFDAPSLTEMQRRRRAYKWSPSGSSPVGAGVADMDFAPAPEVIDALRRFVDDRSLGYPAESIADDVRASLIDRMATRYGWAIGAEQIALLNDAVQGIFYFTDALSRPGDAVALLTPCYPPFRYAAAQLGRHVIEVPFERTGETWTLDLDPLRATVGDSPAPLVPGERVALVHVCNPHNPTGRMLRRDELEQIAELVLEHDLYVVSDEIHADLGWDREHIPFATLDPEVAARTITLTAATKAFNLAATHLAFAIYGSTSLAHRLPPLASRLYGRPGPFGMIATQAAWTNGAGWLEQCRSYLRSNRDHVVARLRDELPDTGIIAPEATYLAWIDLRPYGMGSKPARRLWDEAELTVNEGADFGPTGAGYVRLNFATSRSVLDEALDRLVRVALATRSSQNGDER